MFLFFNLFCVFSPNRLCDFMMMDSILKCLYINWNKFPTITILGAILHLQRALLVFFLHWKIPKINRAILNITTFDDA